MGQLIIDLKQRYHLSNEIIDKIFSVARTCSFKKGETVFEEDQRHTELLFIDKGLVKSFFFREGRERIFSFSFEGEMVVMPTSHHKRTQVSLCCIEDTDFIAIKESEFRSLAQEVPEIALWGYEVMRNIVSIYAAEYIDLFWKDKKDQYEYLLERHPDIFQRIPLKDIASYLNITRSSLSRIRANIK